MIIDFHTHTFPEKISIKVMDKLSKVSGAIPDTTGSIPALVESMKNAKIDYSINLPVMTSPNQVVSVNTGLIESKQSMLESGIITFGGMHPDFIDYKAELKRLKREGIVGIKLHPAYQNMDLDDIRMMRIIASASELGLIVLIHAGYDIGIYDHNYSSVAHILKVLKEVQPEKFVLAHMGNWAFWNEVESDLAGAPVWLDSSFSIGPINQRQDGGVYPYNNVVLEDEDFLRLTRKHGIDKVLFATDCPWQGQKKYVERFQNIGLTKEEQHLFFAENAVKLLGLSL
ncbi:MAG: amidohydrolase family protein [Lachnospiraceae bacterium]